MTNYNDFSVTKNCESARTHRLSTHIRKEIEITGYLSFARFMEMALYYPALGYYQAETITIGERGHFTTAPEISPLFTRCFAKQIASILYDLGAGSILELGAGTGQFAKTLLLELNHQHDLPDYYYIYEISTPLKLQQQALLKEALPFYIDRIIWLSALPTDFKGIIVANEVIDALPVHCFHLTDAAPKERCVKWERDQFTWHLAAATHPTLEEKIAALTARYPLYAGYESEINLGLPTFIHALTSCLKQGVILLADYGYGQAEYYHPERSQGSLCSFYQHQRQSNPLLFPGLQDITAHVDFTAVIDSAADNGCLLLGYTSQAAFLLACGLLEYAEQKSAALSATDTFKLHQGIKTLTLPSEMGERIKIMALGKNYERTLLGFHFQDRRRELSF